jgi:predicted Zn-dependent protease
MAQILTKAQQNEQLKEAAQFHQAALGYLKLGDNEAAKKQLDLAIIKAPGNAQLLALRAKAEIGLKDRAGSLSDARIAVGADPTLGLAHLVLGQAMQAAGAPTPDYLAELAKAKELDPAFTADYEAALAASQAGVSPDKQVDANGIGLAGRRAMQGFNPQAARDQLFGFLPEPARKFAPIGIVVAMVVLIAAVAAWLKRQNGA